MFDKTVAHFSDLYRPKIDGVSVSLELLHDELGRLQVCSDYYVPKTPGQYVDPDNVFRFSSVPLLLQPEVRFSVPVDPANLTRAYSRHYDIVHMHSPGSMGLMAWQVAKLHNLPLVHTYHAFYPEYRHYLFDGKVVSEHAMNELSRWWAQRSDMIIAPSKKIYDWLLDIGVTRPMHVIPSGIQTERYETDRVKPSYLVKKGFVAPEDVVLLFVGRIASEKALDKLLEYSSRLPKDVLGQVKLVIVGGGSELAHYEEKASSLGIGEKVVFTNYVPVQDMPLVYASADVFTFLSTSETQGLVVTEALASGLSVVLSDDNAYCGMVNEGENGFTVHDESSFVASISSLVLDKEQREAFSVQSRILSKQFDIAITTQKLLLVYDQTITDYREKHGSARFVKTTLEQYRDLIKKGMVELQSKLKQYVPS